MESIGIKTAQTRVVGIVAVRCAHPAPADRLGFRVRAFGPGALSEQVRTSAVSSRAFGFLPL